MDYHEFQKRHGLTDEQMSHIIRIMDDKKTWELFNAEFPGTSSEVGGHTEQEG